MSRRALVTGGAGFIGSHVTELFLADGYDVTILDDVSTGKEANVNPAARLVRASITDTVAATLIRDGRFDVILHLAAPIDVRKSVDDPAWDAAMNIDGSRNLLKAVRKSGYPTRFVFSSSGGAQYGDFVEMPTVETAAKEPQGEAGVVAILCRRILGGAPITAYGDGLQTRDCVYAGDVARANLLADGLKATLEFFRTALTGVPA